MLNFIDNNHSFDMSLTIGHVSCFSLFSAKLQLYRMFLAYFIRVFVQFNLAGEKYPSTMRDFYFKSMLISLKVILNDEKQSLYLNFSKHYASFLNPSYPTSLEENGFILLSETTIC